MFIILLDKGVHMGIFSNLFGSSSQSQVSNINTRSLQILMRQIKKNSNWVELMKTNNSTLYIDKASCYLDDEGDGLFFLWRDIFANKGDVFYFTIVRFNDDESQDFYVLKQISQVSKGSEQYSFKEERYSMDSEDPTVIEIYSSAFEFAEENNFREAPEYIDGLA